MIFANLSGLDDESWQYRLLVGGGYVLAAALSIAIIYLAYLVRVAEVYQAGSDFGYNLGLVGGLLMLSLLFYPLRKRGIIFDDRFGKMEHWFRFHMVAGIFGPILVLFHSTFRIGSMNGGSALYSMVVVLVSGIVGRFIYRHIHFGLYGKHATLAETEAAVEASSAKLGSVFALLPDIEERLKQFNDEMRRPEPSWGFRVWRFMTLRWRSKRLSRQIRKDIKLALVKRWRVERGPRSQLVLNYRLAKGYIEQYLLAVVQASQLAVWERMFSLWHLVHIPFLFLLVLSGVVHVVAVHMY